MAEGFLLGMSMGGTCAATCGPFLVPYMLSEGGLVTVARRVAVLVEFLLGRLIAYLAVAILAAQAGHLLAAMMTPRVQGALLFASACFLAWFSARNLAGRPRIIGGVKCVVPARGFTLLSGFLLGLNLCPPFAVAFARALGMEDAVQAASFFFALFLGTTVYLLPIPFVTNLLRTDSWRRVGGYLGLVAGAWFAVQGLAQWF